MDNVLKLLGYDLSIEYKPEKLNTIPDILSRRHEVCAIQNVSGSILDCLQHIDRAYLKDNDANAIIQELKQGSTTKKHYTLVQDRLASTIRKKEQGICASYRVTNC